VVSLWNLASIALYEEYCCKPCNCWPFVQRQTREMQRNEWMLYLLLYYVTLLISYAHRKVMILCLCTKCRLLKVRYFSIWKLKQKQNIQDTLRQLAGAAVSCLRSVNSSASLLPRLMSVCWPTAPGSLGNLTYIAVDRVARQRTVSAFWRTQKNTSVVICILDR
jgi:hypothetical protein